MAKKVDVNKLKTEIKTLIENESSYNMGFAGDHAIELLWTVIDIIDELKEK